MNTFLWHLELSALGDLDGLGRLVSRSLLHVLNLLHNIVALEDLSENDVAAIEPAGDDGGDAELRAVGVLDHPCTVSACFKCSSYIVSLTFPLLAMLRRPLRVCLSLKFSSGNLAP